jgi:hypothetical protein
MGHEFVPDKICVNPVWVLGNYTLIIFIVMVNESFYTSHQKQNLVSYKCVIQDVLLSVLCL